MTVDSYDAPEYPEAWTETMRQLHMQVSAAFSRFFNGHIYPHTYNDELIQIFYGLARFEQELLADTPAFGNVWKTFDAMLTDIEKLQKENIRQAEQCPSCSVESGCIRTFNCDCIYTEPDVDQYREWLQDSLNQAEIWLLCATQETSIEEASVMVALSPSYIIDAVR